MSQWTCGRVFPRGARGPKAGSRLPSGGAETPRSQGKAFNREVYITPSNVLWKGHRLRIVRVQRCPAPVLRKDTIYLSRGPGFGSGRHPTTRSCLQFLEHLTETWNPPAVLDAGCGSGILSLAAARRGAQRVLGLDADPEAVRTAVRNVTWNRLDTRVRVRFQDVRALRGWYDLILANLDPDTGSVLGCTLAEHVSPEGYLVLSGLSGFERDRAFKRLRDKGGMDPVNECQNMGWCTLVFHRS